MDALKKKVGEAVQSVIEDEFGKKLASHFVQSNARVPPRRRR